MKYETGKRGGKRARKEARTEAKDRERGLSGSKQ